MLYVKYVKNRPKASEKKSLRNVYRRRRKDGPTTDAGCLQILYHVYAHTPFGIGELNNTQPFVSQTYRRLHICNYEKTRHKVFKGEVVLKILTHEPLTELS